MKKLYEIFGQQPLNGDVGIEIEVEGSGFPHEVDERWVSTQDGSLRGENREYIVKGALPITDVRSALEALKVNLKKSKLNFSFRTSVHVHVNVQELSSDQYLNMLYTYMLLEEPLMTYCGKERKGNRFCLRVQDAEGMLDWLSLMFSKGVRYGFDALVRDKVRYSAINVEATKKYGSLEFRGMRGNLDVDVLVNWCHILVSLREFAKTVENPVDVYDMYAKVGPVGFLRAVLGDGLAAELDYPKLVKDIQRSFSLSIDMPFVFKKVVAKAMDAITRVVPGEEGEHDDKAPEHDVADLVYRHKTAIAHVKGGGTLPWTYLKQTQLPHAPAGMIWIAVKEGFKFAVAPPEVKVGPAILVRDVGGVLHFNMDGAA